MRRELFAIIGGASQTVMPQVGRPYVFSQWIQNVEAVIAVFACLPCLADYNMPGHPLDFFFVQALMYMGRAWRVANNPSPCLRPSLTMLVLSWRFSVSI